MGARPQLVGSCTLVTNGVHTAAFASAEVLRQAPDPLVIAVNFDLSRTVPVPTWMQGRHAAIGIIDLATTFPRDGKLDVEPVAISAVCATVDTRGGAAALVTIREIEGKYSRHVVSVQVDSVDGAGMSDEPTRLASPFEEAEAAGITQGGALFAWLPADPVLGRKSETVVVALGVPYLAKIFKPRDLPPIAELVGLEDLGRAVMWNAEMVESGNDLAVVAGEIREKK
jgi:hypothetical protein